MNPLVLLQMFIRDLLEYDVSLIERGRRNFEQQDFETAYIVVDGLGAERALTRSSSFDGDAEEMEYSRKYAKPVTIDFYGPISKGLDGSKAYENAHNFITLIGSQTSKDLQETLGITVGSVSAITDVKALTGQQYGERLQLSIVMHYNVTKSVPTLRIDTAQLSFLVD